MRELKLRVCKLCGQLFEAKGVTPEIYELYTVVN